MSDQSHIRTYKGKAGGKYDGRTFAALAGYHRTARTVLTEAGARFIGAYLLPEGTEAETEALLEKMHAAGIEDHKAVLRDRLPVEAEKAEKIKVGSTFDFGGDVGKAKVTGIGASFTPEKASDSDPRLEALIDKEVVYVYNANEPKAKAAAA
ncbi:MAG: hypothetical protein ABJN42_00045 [Roseibium sp.]|uniref:hypothetical protein n=1 Tax=Roseibium sp. TaxID=1936156 RepID=UPI0032983C1E